MTKKFDIKKVSGTAIVNNRHYVYPDYRLFAEASGYPDAENSSDKGLNNGDVVKILAKGKHEDTGEEIYVIENMGGLRFLIGVEGIEIQVEYGEAVKNAEKALENLRQATYAEGYAQGRFDAGMDLAEKPKESPQEKRDLIVEQAKRDVQRLLGESRLASVPNLDGVLESFHPDGVCPFDEVGFVIDKEMRTVVALIKYINDGRVWATGIAKCAPYDCFNKDIGKAIALYRALGLEVPGKYLNAPQPTEVRVGDKIKFIAPGHTFDGRIETVCGVDEDGAIWTKESSGWVGEGDCEIIDDSNGDDRE